MAQHKKKTVSKKKDSLEELKKKVKSMEDYLGPKLDWSMNHWPMYEPDRWILEYCMLLKQRYYQKMRRMK
ncbi:hypothetical protein HN419_04635 [Candidatus Woesearchaeota archaeon]|jgi:hypothetical protein|nr:hypothetical protein [Candidatus Woesearchaeota archaeon]MBT3537837.1 hypothetical protein [Candidatus Woesearchaeota archaeon]MBT4697968.1 hypothetical protein [Candidatus Woesearchaeota archaeon]MBT7105506.1 hypothetical protein [Candidatus Woesearchaeota archaeon]MBT7931696.1 hypothetical protein [Candidatus Woesearchaeota archaeon]